MHRPIYEVLKQVAKAQATTTYGAIAPLAGLVISSPADRDELSDILGEISTYEHEQGRPMLSAVVILERENRPGHGFFTLARELGLHTGHDDDGFFCLELERVHGAWT